MGRGGGSFIINKHININKLYKYKYIKKNRYIKNYTFK